MSAFAVLVLALVASVASVYFRRKEAAGGLPRGQVLYEDTDGQRIKETLVAHRHGLAGRPDYVVQTPDGAVPIEVKSRACGAKGPYPGEEAQLFAYCLLVEDVTGGPVRAGILQFADRQWPLTFGERERRRLLGILDEMRDARQERDVKRSHAQAGKCRGCGFRAADVCGQSIAGTA